MTAQVIKVTSYDSRNSKSILYTIQDGDKYYVDKEYGYIEYFFCKEEANKHINDELIIPFDTSEYYDIMEIDGWFGVFDSNMNMILEDWCQSIDRLEYLIKYEYSLSMDKFNNYRFSDDIDCDDNDYDCGDYYDNPSSYYDPRYDGPYHYIPVGNH